MDATDENPNTTDPGIIGEGVSLDPPELADGCFGKVLVEIVGPLTFEQHSRVAALAAAESALRTTRHTVGDLTYLAEWILDGPARDDEDEDVPEPADGL